MSRGWWLALQVVRRLWFRAALYAVIAFVTAILGIVLGPLIPERMSDMVGADAVDGILSIIAASMLTVTTFSLSTLVSATSSAATSGTPRAISLVLQDRTAQSALSTFLGAFLFSLVGIIALNTHLYGGGGRLVLLAATLIVVLLIVVMLLRWIDHLAGLGQVGETIDRVADSTRAALTELSQQPCMGCHAMRAVPPGARPVYPLEAGYVRHIDLTQLSSLAEDLDRQLYLAKRPGDFCSPSTPLIYISALDHQDAEREAILTAMRKAFTLGHNRSFEQDPMFGLTVLSEIASRALSPGINDPGTATDVIVQATRLFCDYFTQCEAAAKDKASGRDAKHSRLHLRPFTATELVEAAFLPISRDGAAFVEVAISLQQALSGLSASSDQAFADAARAMSRTARDRAMASLTFEDDRQRLQQWTDPPPAAEPISP
ncbi:DUF2254 domain-containing protein [Rhizobium sp. RU36D]|uniref:DUF2254 domain-containing protein n=1 Tax=Rhizobium sp. RU36D TaxID=1907415 RepID=UPI0009D7F6CB|nr:DUF2254 domain-containing protein [Rhizobium sp. RU36D]SMD19190.1 Uncharacterized membrane protein [Rhizobium sp. RU36D]